MFCRALIFSISCAGVRLASSVAKRMGTGNNHHSYNGSTIDGVHVILGDIHQPLWSSRGQVL